MTTGYVIEEQLYIRIKAALATGEMLAQHRKLDALAENFNEIFSELNEVKPSSFELMEKQA
jgi:hypothetical protein